MGGGLTALRKNLDDAITNLNAVTQEKVKVDSEVKLANDRVTKANTQLITTNEKLSPILEDIGKEGGGGTGGGGYSGVGRKVRDSRIKSKKRKSKKKSHKRKSKKRKTKRRSKRQ